MLINNLIAIILQNLAFKVNLIKFILITFLPLLIFLSFTGTEKSKVNFRYRVHTKFTTDSFNFYYKNYTNKYKSRNESNYVYENYDELSSLAKLNSAILSVDSSSIINPTIYLYNDSIINMEFSYKNQKIKINKCPLDESSGHFNLISYFKSIDNNYFSKEKTIEHIEFFNFKTLEIEISAEWDLKKNLISFILKKHSINGDILSVISRDIIQNKYIEKQLNFDNTFTFDTIPWIDPCTLKEHQTILKNKHYR